MIPFFLMLTFFFSTAAKESHVNSSRSELKKAILQGCISMSNDVADKKLLVCKCVVDNFDIKLNDAEMQMVSENYKKKAADDEKEMVGSALQSFDYEVAEACIKNPKWRIKK